MNEQVNNGTEVNNGTNVVEPQQAIPVTTTEPKVIVVEKENWFKRHWKGVVATSAAILTTVTSAFCAYKKGTKAGYNTGFNNGVNSIIPNNNNEYSLNPNVEE